MSTPYNSPYNSPAGGVPVKGATYLGYCQLGVYTYPYNATSNTIDAPTRDVKRVRTWNGNITFDWGFIRSDGTIVQTWENMEPAVYRTFESMKLNGGVYPFTDEWGTQSSVVVGNLTYTSIGVGGGAFVGVTLELWPQ